MPAVATAPSSAGSRTVHAGPAGAHRDRILCPVFRPVLCLESTTTPTSRQEHPMNLIHRVQALVHDDEAVTAIEYGLIAALIAVFIIASVALVGSKLDAIFSAVATAVATAISG